MNNNKRYIRIIQTVSAAESREAQALLLLYGNTQSFVGWSEDETDSLFTKFRREGWMYEGFPLQLTAKGRAHVEWQLTYSVDTVQSLMKDLSEEEQWRMNQNMEATKKVLHLN